MLLLYCKYLKHLSNKTTFWVIIDTSIGEWVFFCNGFTSVIIGNSVARISNAAFDACRELTDVYCYAEAVPTTDFYAFSETPIENITLHVPTASIEAYRTTAPWSGFKAIVALTDNDPKPTGIKYVEFQKLDESRKYDLNGRRLAISQKGLNFIKTNDGKTKKVIVKYKTRHPIAFSPTPSD